MTAPSTPHDLQEHFAHCIQVFGGVTAASRRLGIDERALRRFVNGEKPVSTNLLEDTANALRQMIAEATAAEAKLTVVLGSAD
jgi:phenylalanyl-tRNA synthetase beta subunit